MSTRWVWQEGNGYVDDMGMDHGGFGRCVPGDGSIGMVKRERDEFDPPPTKLWVYTAWITAAFVVWGLLFAGTADASPVCVHRSAAHAAEHGTTVAADSRWHVRHGELPTCGHENDGQRASDDRDDRRDRSEYRPSKKRWFNDDGKSRFCRKRWWC